MIGSRYWSTGITVWRAYGTRDEWFAEVSFFDDGFCQGGSTEGLVRTLYAVPLHTAVDVLKADVERLGIEFQYPDGGPRIYYRGDGENADCPPPAGWRLRIEATARRLGWRSPYAPKEVA